MKQQYEELTVWIVKMAVPYGIYEAEVDHDGDGYVFPKLYTGIGGCFCNTAKKTEWCRTREEAEIVAAQMRQKEIEKLQKKIEKLKQPAWVRPIKRR